MVEGGSGAGAAGGASTAFVAPVASIEASAPAFAPAPDVAPTAEAPVGGADVTAVVPDGGHAGEAQSAQVATDADRLEDVQDRLAQQSGQTAEDRPADGASDGDPAVQASAAGEPLPADQAGAGETVSAEEVAAKGETPAEGEAAAGKQVDEGETPVSVEGDASGEAGAPTEPAAEGEGGAGDLEFADPATIAEVGLDTRQTRLALEILAGKLNVHSAAARVIHAELDEAMKDLPQDASRAQKAWRFFTKATVVPRAAQRLGTSGAKKEVSSNAGKHGAEANAIAERALQIMLHGTPTEQAFALDAQIALAKASLMTVSGDAEAKIKAQIEGLSAQRGVLP